MSFSKDDDYYRSHEYNYITIAQKGFSIAYYYKSDYDNSSYTGGADEQLIISRLKDNFYEECAKFSYSDNKGSFSGYTESHAQIITRGKFSF